MIRSFVSNFSVALALLALVNSQVFGGLDSSALDTITEDVKLDSETPSSVTNMKSLKKADCHVRPLVHELKHKDCKPMLVPSAACVGLCHSYVQVSSSKFWQTDRSCNCCQETATSESTFFMHCPKMVPQFRKVTVRSPKECACRPCSAVDESQVKPQEIVELQRN